MNNIEDRIQVIEERNRRVEADKSWETSLARRVLIIGLTYLVMVIFFYYANIDRPWVSAVVPALAYAVSTFTFDFAKKQWLSRR